MRDDYGWLAGFTPEARARLREAGAMLAGLRASVGLPIPELVRLIELELRLDIELAANEMMRVRRASRRPSCAPSSTRCAPSSPPTIRVHREPARLARQGRAAR